MTKNFKIKEFITSETADKYHIDNMPRKYEIIDNIWTLCSEVLQPLRDAMGFPITITSGYRCPTLNMIVGGVEGSQHLNGTAADINCGLGNNKKIYDWLKKQKDNGKLPIYELLWEGNGSWVHVSVNKNLINNK